MRYEPRPQADMRFWGNGLQWQREFPNYNASNSLAEMPTSGPVAMSPIISRTHSLDEVDGFGQDLLPISHLRDCDDTGGESDDSNRERILTSPWASRRQESSIFGEVQSNPNVQQASAARIRISFILIFF